MVIGDINHVDRDDIFRLLQTVIGEVCGVDPTEVRGSARLTGYGLDSLRVLELIVRAEEEFGIELKPEDLVEIKTTDQLVDYIQQFPRRSGGVVDRRSEIE